MNECLAFEPLLERLERAGTVQSPERIAGDKAYSSWRIRDWLRSRGIQPIIPHRRDQEAYRQDRPFDRRTYRKRNIIERLVGFIKERRRVGTRFEKLAIHYAGMVQLVFVEIYFKKAF